MNAKQWKNTKRSGSYRRKVMKAYKDITKLNTNLNCSTQQILLSKKNNCKEKSTELNNTDESPHIIFGDSEGSVHTRKYLPTSSGNYYENERNEFDGESSDSDDDEKKGTKTEYENICDFRNKIRTWSLQNNISHLALRSLAQILNDRTPNLLPVDPRTLLKTKRHIVTSIIEPGEYWHNGLIKPLTKFLEHCSDGKDNGQMLISLCFNIDGLPVSNSSKQQFWPILCSIFEKPEISPFIIGIYAGLGKPKDLNAFLLAFVEELNELLLKGLVIGNMKVTILVRCFVCDSPARAMIKGVCNFNGKHGCNKCTVIGEYSHVSHTVIFPETDCPARNDEDFRKKMYGGHHKMDSTLLNLPIDMVESFPVADSLHLIDLGIMKRLLVGWRDGNFSKKNTKWRANDIQIVNIFLNSCRTPTEIHRSVRGLDNLSHWKGSELRTFFLYLSIIILQDVLSHDAMVHFLALFCSITICSNEEYFKYLRLAKSLLKHFVEHFKTFYGVDYITSNVHNLTHLVDEVQRFGKLQSFNAYPYENKLYMIKKMLRQGNKPLSQVAKRLSEYDDLEINNVSNCSKTDYPYLKKNMKSHEFILCFKDFILSAKTTDKYFMTTKQEIMEIRAIKKKINQIYIYCYIIDYKENVFEQPILSSYLNIFKCKLNVNSKSKYVCFPNDVKFKFIAIEHKFELYLLPLLHTV